MIAHAMKPLVICPWLFQSREQGIIVYRKLPPSPGVRCQIDQYADILGLGIWLVEKIVMMVVEEDLNQFRVNCLDEFILCI